MSDDNGSVSPEDNNALSPKDGATGEGVSLNALTMEELQAIVRNEKYRPLLNELLPTKGDSDTPHDVSDDGSASTGKTTESNCNKRAPSRARKNLPKKTRGKSRKDDNSHEDPDGKNNVGGTDHSSSSKRRAYHSSKQNDNRGADHSSGSKNHRRADHSSSGRSNRRADHSSKARRSSTQKHPSRRREKSGSRSRRYHRGVESSSSDEETNHDRTRRAARSTKSRVHPARSRRRKRPRDDSSESDHHTRPRKRPLNYSREDASRHKRPRAETPHPSNQSTSESTDASTTSQSETDESDRDFFDPSLEQEDRDEFRVDVPQGIEKYLNRHFRKSLTKEERTAMLKKHPKPNVKAAFPPKLDLFVSEFAGKRLDKARDAQLTRVQASVLYIANPLTNFWSNLMEQGLAQDPDATISVTGVTDVIQRTLVLLGNANNLISETRREIALEAIHSSLKKYGKGDFSKAEESLFGEAFKETLIKKVEADSVLTKAVNIVSRNTKGRDNQYQRPQSKYGRKDRFFGSRASGYGAVPGRTYHPYSRGSFQGRGRHTPGRPFTRRGGVFNRLGPQSQDKSHQRPVQNQSN